MTTHKGFAGVAVIVVIGLLVLGGAGYVALNPDVLKPATEEKAVEEGNEAQADVVLSGEDIHWKFDTKAEVDGMPQTMVSVQVGEMVHEVGTYAGSCAVVGAEGGVDGKGLLAGELSAAQCWFAGGGDEIGVFAHEDGGYEIMVGALEEPIEGSAGFRGDFEITHSISL